MHTHIFQSTSWRRALMAGAGVLLATALAACGTPAASTAVPMAAAQPATAAPAPTATSAPAATATLPPTAAPIVATSTPDDGIVEVQVKGGEFSFESTLSTFTVDTPYRFVVENAGVLPHEWLVEKVDAAGADAHAHTDHSDLLSSIGEAEFGPGMSATREVVFSAPGVYEFACRIPGHYEAGMKQTIQVEE